MAEQTVAGSWKMSKGVPVKLTDRDVAEVRRRLDAGETHRSIAERFGVSRPLISLIKSGRKRGRT